MQELVKDKICLVSGATRGIGKAIAMALAEQGGIVYGTATSAAGAQAITDYFQQTGGKGYGRVLNVNDADGITALIAEITEQSGAPEILVNNAGITRDNLLLRMKPDEWDDIMATNLKSAFLMSKACLKGMTKARNGRIISISSVVGATGNAGQANYAAAKAGLVGFSKSLAREVASRNITVNVIAPGFVETDMTAALSDEQKSALISQIPLNRMAQVTEIAAAVLFLAAPHGGYITGETLHVNGGMHMA